MPTKLPDPREPDPRARSRAADRAPSPARRSRRPRRVLPGQRGSTCRLPPSNGCARPAAPERVVPEAEDVPLSPNGIASAGAGCAGGQAVPAPAPAVQQRPRKPAAAGSIFCFAARGTAAVASRSSSTRCGPSAARRVKSPGRPRSRGSAAARVPARTGAEREPRQPRSSSPAWWMGWPTRFMPTARSKRSFRRAPCVSARLPELRSHIENNS